MMTELNFCDVTWKRRRIVPEYAFERAKQQYLILLDDIVPKNGEQFLTFKRFSDSLDSFYARLLEEKEEFEAQ